MLGIRNVTSGMCHFLHFLDHLIRKRRPGTGVLPNSETGKEAGCNPKGGLRSPFEGLALSRRPCARVLSVPGFFAVPGRFPWPEGFILRVKETSFLPGEAVRVDVTNGTVNGEQSMTACRP